MDARSCSLRDPTQKRLIFIDALRVAAIVFVPPKHTGRSEVFRPCMIAPKATVHSILYWD